MKTIAQKLLDLGFKRPLSDETTHAVIDELAVARRTIERLEEDNAARLEDQRGAERDRDAALDKLANAYETITDLKHQLAEANR